MQQETLIENIVIPDIVEKKKLALKLETKRQEKKKKKNADFHTHLYTTWEEPNPEYLSLERGSRDFNYITNYCKNKGVDVIVLTNFLDTRYEKFTSKLSNRKVHKIENAVYIPSIDFTVIRGQEIPTKQGHILTIGLKKNIRDKRNLEDTLKEAKDNNSIVIADHPFSRFVFGEGIAKNSTELLDKYLELGYIDAIESFNASIPGKAKKLAKKYIEEKARQGIKVTGISNTDSHNLRDIGTSYTTIPDKLNINSTELLNKSLIDIFKRGNLETVERPLPLYSAFEHAGLIIYNTILEKLGFIYFHRKTSKEI